MAANLARERRPPSKELVRREALHARPKRLSPFDLSSAGLPGCTAAGSSPVFLAAMITKDTTIVKTGKGVHGT